MTAEGLLSRLVLPWSVVVTQTITWILEQAQQNRTYLMYVITLAWVTSAGITQDWSKQETIAPPPLSWLLVDCVTVTHVTNPWLSLATPRHPTRWSQMKLAARNCKNRQTQETGPEPLAVAVLGPNPDISRPWQSLCPWPRTWLLLISYPA